MRCRQRRVSVSSGRESGMSLMKKLKSMRSRQKPWGFQTVSYLEKKTTGGGLESTYHGDRI